MPLFKTDGINNVPLVNLALIFVMDEPIIFFFFRIVGIIFIFSLIMSIVICMFSYKPITINISFRIVGIIFILSPSCICFLTNQLLLTFLSES